MSTKLIVRVSDRLGVFESDHGFMGRTLGLFTVRGSKPHRCIKAVPMPEGMKGPLEQLLQEDIVKLVISMEGEIKDLKQEIQDIKWPRRVVENLYSPRGDW